MTNSDKKEQQKQQNFTVDQWRYIAASLENPTMSKKKLAEHINIPSDTVYGWTRNDKSIDEYISSIMQNAVSAAKDALSQMLMKAVLVKLSGLDSEEEDVRQKVSSEIIDRVMGKATQPTELTGKNGGAIETKDVSLDDDARIERIATLLDRARARRDGDTL